MSRPPTVLVTGSTRGVGAAMAAAFTARGCLVIRHGSQAGDGVSTGVGEDVIAADLADYGAPELLWTQALARAGGRLDVLVNNAAVYAANPLDNSDIAWLDGWEDTLRVNLTAPAQLARFAVRQWLADDGGGCLINIADRAAHCGSSPDHWHYAAAKAGMVAMTRTIARAYAGHGILAFAICPGVPEASTDAAPAPATPLGRAATAEEIASIAAFCALDAPESMTGAVLDADGVSYGR